MHKISMKAVAAATVIGGAMAAAVSASAALNLPTQNCAYQFNTNLRVGSRGTDVMNLQKVLNAYPQTRVAESGAGSPGMETTYFGAATRAAVNKFHTLHLVELGITAPTGNVFAGTRGLLNAICQVSNNPGQGNPGGNPGGNTGTTGPVSAMLAASQPTGMIVQGQAGARLADITFTGNGTVTSVQLQRTGVSTDTTLSNVYLYEGNTRITDAASVVTGGYINFNAPAGLFTVAGSRTITVRADIADSTSGQSVGVKLNSVTASGAVSTYSNVMGNSLQIATVTPATAYLATMVTTALTVDAGTTNFNVWRSTLNIGTRDVLLRAATFKFVGSAPVDAIQNLSLYIDGTKVAGPVSVNAANNNKVVFDLGATPYVVRTGAHTIDVRGDVVKGSNRTATFSIENSADLMLEDSNLAGVNVTTKSGSTSGSAIGSTNSAYGQITVNQGTVTAQTDTAFSATQVTGGASNMTIGQFTLKAYGEDVKVNTLAVLPSITGTTPGFNGLANVSLYVNGGQVSTSQNYTGVSSSTALTYNLGSSLIIPAGQTVTVTVKADIKTNAGVNYTAGTVSAALGGVALNAQGQSSNELISVAYPSVSGNSLTIASGIGSFAKTAGFVAANVSPSAQNLKIGSWTVTAGSAESTIVNSATVTLSPSDTATLNNYSTLTLKDGATVLGSIIPNAQSSNTFSFGDIVIPVNTSRALDLYANLNGSTTAALTPTMTVTYRGSVSNNPTTSSGVAGPAITSLVASLADATLASDAPAAQYVVGGATQLIAKYKVKTSASDATVTELQFRTTGTDAIESISVNGGPAVGVVSAGTTTVAVNIPVTTTGTDVFVTAKYSQFKNAGNPPSASGLTSGVATTKVTLGQVKATPQGGGTAILNTTPVDSNTMSLVASKPTVTVASGATGFNLGSLSKIGEFTVMADANGNISVASTSITISTNGITAPELATSTLVLRDAVSNTAISGVTLVTNAGATASTTPVFTFTTPYEISAGTSKTFAIWGTISGSQQSGIAQSVSTSLTSGATFKWVDVIGGNTTYTGAAIPNFPSTAYVSRSN